MAGTPVQGDVGGWEAVDGAEQDGLPPPPGLHQGDEGRLLGCIYNSKDRFSPPPQKKKTDLVARNKPVGFGG